MALSPLLPLAGSALSIVADRAIDAVKDGLSFLDVLRQQPENDEAAAPVAKVDPADLIAKLQEHFKRLGVDVASPVHLKQDGRGRVIVDDAHPDRVLIESLFNSDADLTQAFNAVAIAAVKQGTDDHDPKAFRLTIDSAGTTIGFE